MPLRFGATRLRAQRSVEGLSKCRSAEAGELPQLDVQNEARSPLELAVVSECRNVGMSEWWFCKVSALQVSLVELGEAQWMWADMAEFRVVRSSHFLSLQGWNITFLIQQLLSHPNCDSYSGNRCRFCARQAIHLSLATASNLAAMLTAEVSRHDP